MNDFKLFFKLSSEEVCGSENETPVYFKKPVIVSLLEMDKQSEIKYTNCIRYFKLPKMQHYPLNLNLGLENYQFRNEIYSQYKLRNVFRYLMDQNNDSKNERVDTDIDESLSHEKFDVISHRGALMQLLIAPLSTGLDDNWIIYATFYKKKLYLCRTTGRDRAYSAADTYHFKFAQYCFTDNSDQDPDTSVPIHEEEQMYCIYRSQMKNLNFLYSAEINGIISDKKLKNVQNVKELNQCRFVHTKLMKKNIRNWRTDFRIQNWWAKSYFAGVNDIYVGFRSENGYVHDPVEHIFLHELMREQQWSHKVCTAFLYKILTKIIDEVKDVNCPYTTYEFRFDSIRRVIEFKKHEGKTDKSFLSEEYIEYIK